MTDRDEHGRTPPEETGRSVALDRRALLKVSGLAVAGVAGGAILSSRDGSDDRASPTNDTARETASPTSRPDSSTVDRPETASGNGSESDAVDGSASDSEGESYPDPIEDVDGSNPYVYMNDQGADNITEELALALHASGMIDLEGFLVAYPPEHWISEEKYERDRNSYIEHHRTVREKAVESGFDDLPPAELGLFQRHRKPSSGAIEDTEPIGSTGTDRILRAASEASPDNPLVVTAGGDICTLADAYLTDPTIADRVVLYWTEQLSDTTKPDLGYNLVQSGWSSYIVLNRIATVIESKEIRGPRITKRAIRERVPQPLQEFMLTKKHWKFGKVFADGPKFDGDSKAVLLATNPDARGGGRSLAIDGLQTSPGSEKQTLPRIMTSSEATRLKQVRELKNPTRQWWEPWRKL